MKSKRDFQLFPSTSNSSESSISPNQSVNLNWAYPMARDQYQTTESVGQSMRQVCFCDPSELQARVILWLARRETEDKFKYKMGIGMQPPMHVQLINHGLHGMSLKKSLHRFLQKRKDRIQSSIPYKHTVIGKLNGSKFGDI